MKVFNIFLEKSQEYEKQNPGWKILEIFFSFETEVGVALLEEFKRGENISFSCRMIFFKKDKLTSEHSTFEKGRRLQRAIADYLESSIAP